MVAQAATLALLQGSRILDLPVVYAIRHSLGGHPGTLRVVNSGVARVLRGAHSGSGIAKLRIRSSERMLLALGALSVQVPVAFQPAAGCDIMLRQLCSSSTTASTCESCAGSYQVELQHAGCAPADVTSFCAAASGQLRCGVASSVFSDCPTCFRTAAATGALGFWWNWGTEVELDRSALSQSDLDAAQSLHVPMQWGQGLPPAYDFLSSGSTHVMGFNEPDMYGPSCDGDWNPPGAPPAPAASIVWLHTSRAPTTGAARIQAMGAHLVYSARQRRQAGLHYSILALASGRTAALASPRQHCIGSGSSTT